MEIKVNSAILTRTYSIDGDKVVVTGQSPFFGETKWSIPIHDLGTSKDDLLKGLVEMSKGVLIQDAFPDMSSDQRELLLTNFNGPRYKTEIPVI